MGCCSSAVKDAEIETSKAQAQVQVLLRRIHSEQKKYEHCHNAACVEIDQLKSQLSAIESPECKTENAKNDGSDKDTAVNRLQMLELEISELLSTAAAETQQQALELSVVKEQLRESKLNEVCAQHSIEKLTQRVACLEEELWRALQMKKLDEDNCVCGDTRAWTLERMRLMEEISGLKSHVVMQEQKLAELELELQDLLEAAMQEARKPGGTT
ncbi:hypothetical protein CEUSTIGMA_g353.t1 [Chlamydomonas eustigma]|uniref:Uncharacterized protein n=1 Tax=Chlamydomonas eustigma TaxID=1157962 RepID=A0A250WPZ2_9CHLO|nr:hypothetical protein CEUSTIGMA_g353.t1 [Chlamydomonas eustigma]|eukprot:GAX72898.1 hypothetical protein CEUSTIGMA_g353.t1 [Chlamydomonas eustigma]